MNSHLQISKKKSMTASHGEFQIYGYFYSSHSTWKSSTIKFKITGTRFIYSIPIFPFFSIFSGMKYCKIAESIKINASIDMKWINV